MFSLSSAHTYYFYKTPTDMRKSFDSLSGLVRSGMKRDPFNGSIYIFINKQRNMIKLLHWESGGFTLYYKRLEKGRFSVPDFRSGSVEIKWSDLVLMMEGIEVKNIQKSLRFSFQN